MRAVKYLASLVVLISILAECPVWNLDIFDKILEGDTELVISEPKELAFLLDCVFPSAED